MSDILCKSRSVASRLTLFSLVCCASLTYAQIAPTTTQSAPAKKNTKTEPPAPKLTPEQERGLRLLKAAEAEAAAGAEGEAPAEATEGAGEAGAEAAGEPEES